MLGAVAFLASHKIARDKDVEAIIPIILCTYNLRG